MFSNHGWLKVSFNFQMRTSIQRILRINILMIYCQCHYLLSFGMSIKVCYAQEISGSQCFCVKQVLYSCLQFYLLIVIMHQHNDHVEQVSITYLLCIKRTYNQEFTLTKDQHDFFWLFFNISFQSKHKIDKHFLVQSSIMNYNMIFFLVRYCFCNYVKHSNWAQ